MVVNSLRSKNYKQFFGQHCQNIFVGLKQVPRILKLVWQAYPFAAITIPSLALLSGPLSALYLYSWKKVIDGVELWLRGDTASGREKIVLFMSLGFIIVLAQLGLERLLRFMEQLLQLKLTHFIQNKILIQATTLDMTFFETPSFYDKLQRAQQEAAARPYTILSSLIAGARQCVTLCSYMVVLFTLSWWTLPYILLVTMPGLFIQAKFGRLRWTIQYNRTPEERRMFYYQHLLTSRPEAKEIRLFGLANYLISQWRKMFWQFYQQDRRVAARRNLSECGVVVVHTTATVGFYAFAIYRTITDPLVTIGSLLMYTQAMERSVASMSVVFQAIGSLYENGLYINNLFDYLSLQPLVCTPKAPALVPKQMRQGINFKSVSFRYPGTTEYILNDISFEISAGERIAIVGENGAGKTTLVKLLARLYDPQQGKITVDGIDLREFDPGNWYKQIGIIFQDFVHYCVTAQENIGFGELMHLEDIARIRSVAKLSGAAECIERLEKGWKTILGKFFDEGQDLSVGEWQRIALGRAILRDAQILVLDEPTASLDAKQEYEIFAKFSEIAKGKTTVLISHRFSTVRMADRIFVIERGRILESGTHDELIALNNRYAMLFERQASAYR